jgi:hypothetical protein
MTSIAIAAAVCGSTGTMSSTSVRTETSAGTTTPGATPARFITAADAICQALHAQQQPVNARVGALTQETSTARAQLQSLLRQSVVYVHAADNKLKALPQPSGEAAEIDRLLAGYEEEAEEVSSLADSLTRLEPGRQQFASGSLERTTASDRKLAESLGMKVCAASE